MNFIENLKKSEKMMNFIKNYKDGDIQFEMEAEEPEGRFLSIYTMDTENMRSLMRADQKDVFEECNIYEYGDDYDIDFYTEYYPHTEDVAVKVSMSVCSIYPDARHDLNILMDSCDRVKDGYIQLTEAEKKEIRDAVKEYAMDEIEEFMDMEADEIEKE